MEDNSQPQEKETIDIRRYNRKERRHIGPQLNLKIAGRNLPFTKVLHGTLANYNAMRARELADEKKPTS